MKDYKLLFVLGLIVLFFPFLGIPEFFRNLVVAIVGVFLLGYAIYLRSIIKPNEIKKSDVYVESEIPELVVNNDVLEEGESFEEEFNKKEDE